MDPRAAPTPAAPTTAAALGEVGTLLLGGTGVVLAVGVTGSVLTGGPEGPALALLLAVALLAALAWPTAWLALLAGRVPAAAGLGAAGLLASLAVPVFYAAETGSRGDAWRALVLPLVVTAALVVVVVRGRRGSWSPPPPCGTGRGLALLAVAVLVIAVSVVLDAALARAGTGVGAVLDVSSVTLAAVLTVVGIGAAARLGPARVRALGLVLLAGPVVSQVAPALGSGAAGTGATVLRWTVLVVLLGLAAALLVRGAVPSPVPGRPTPPGDRATGVTR